jgi:bacteriocin-like protein
MTNNSLSEGDKQMRKLTNEELQEINGGLSYSEGLAALGVVIGAGAIATAAPVAAGAALVGVMGICAVDIWSSWWGC